MALLNVKQIYTILYKYKGLRIIKNDMFKFLDYSGGYKYFLPGESFSPEVGCLQEDKMKKQTRKAKTGAPFPMPFSIA